MPDIWFRKKVVETADLSFMSVEGPATVANSGTATYKARVVGTMKLPVTWSTTGGHGSINASTGVFTASSTGSQTITAANVFNGAKTASKVITVV